MGFFGGHHYFRTRVSIIVFSCVCAALGVLNVIWNTNIVVGSGYAGGSIDYPLGFAAGIIQVLVCGIFGIWGGSKRQYIPLVLFDIGISITMALNVLSCAFFFSQYQISYDTLRFAWFICSIGASGGILFPLGIYLTNHSHGKCCVCC